MRFPFLHDRDLPRAAPAGGGAGRSSLRRGWQVLAGAGLAVALAGCSTFQPQADPTRFYVLANPARTDPVAPVAGAPAVHVRRVELAGYLRARPLIVRKGETEVEFHDFARWGEPLEQGVARELAEELVARGAAGTVALSGVRGARRVYEYELSVKVLACEGSADGGVEFRARWELMPNPAVLKTALPARGEFRAEGLKWDGKSDASLVAELSRAVAGLGGEIARALPAGR